jgi:hypoxanthine phosphoribosyltransferase
MRSYDYAHRQGVLEISWEDFACFAAKLAEMIAPLQPQIILGVARAGLFPATAVACWLQSELYPVRLTRRLNDQVVYPQPVWRVPVPDEVAGKVVLVVDEIADTGETLTLVADAARAKGAAKVFTACLASHTWANPIPDIVSLPSDAFIIFPWDSQRYFNKNWQLNPEILAGLQAQSKDE